MAKILILFALCILPALVTARPVRNPYSLVTAHPVKKANPYVVRGRVYCDTCKCGYETTATTYIEGARVRIKCKVRNSQDLVYTAEGVTDSTGTYFITVNEDHKDQICDAVLVSSPQKDCKTIKLGQEKARVILTDDNGISSNMRYANNLGFQKDEASEGCTQVLKQYYTEEEDV